MFLILWQYSQNELKSDRMWKDWERIGRVGLHWSFTDDGQIWEETPCVASPAMIVPRLKDDFREIEDYTRFIYLSSYRSGRGALISFESGSQRAVFKEERIAFADANLFTFFGIPFIYGEAVKSLPNGNSVCISRSTARKYFGEKNPLGEILTLNDTLPLQVTGVFSDLPTNSHLQFNIVISNQHHLKQWAISSLDPLVQSYIKAQSPVDWPRLEAKMNDSKEKYYGEAMRTWKNGRIRTLLQPLEDVAFDNRRFTPFKAKSKPMLIAFAATGIAVLIIAWINYIILTLSRAKKRMKEVATRKVSGASFKDFASQFIMESFVLNAFSLAFGITLLQFVSGSVILLFGIPFKGFGGMDAWSILTLLTTFLAGILTTGLYPALMSARYHPRALFNIGT